MGGLDDDIARRSNGGCHHIDQFLRQWVLPGVMPRESVGAIEQFDLTTLSKRISSHPITGGPRLSVASTVQFPSQSHTDEYHLWTQQQPHGGKVSPPTMTLPGVMECTPQHLLSLQRHPAIGSPISLHLVCRPGCASPLPFSSLILISLILRCCSTSLLLAL